MIIKQVFLNEGQYVQTDASNYLLMLNGKFMDFSAVYAEAEKGDIVIVGTNSRFRAVLKKGGKV